MAYDYDALYNTSPDALGAPTQVFVDFFAAIGSEKRRVLDFACGQGCDALFISRLGHSVVDVNLSPNCVRDLNTAAARTPLKLRASPRTSRALHPKGGLT